MSEGIPRRVWGWAAGGWVPRAVAWAVVLAIAFNRYHTARSWLANTPDTPDGVRRPFSDPLTHTQIDFGGQWVMGRMIALGHGRQLYHRQVQWQVVRAGYPVSEETPAQREDSLQSPDQWRFARTADDTGHDADGLMWTFMGADPAEWKTVGGAAALPLAADLTGNPLAALAHGVAAHEAVTPEVVAAVSEPAIGGPLYPPVHGLFYAPLGLIDSPRVACHVFQCVALGFAFLAGLGLSALSRWRVWWSGCTAAVLLFPGCGPSLELGQNPTLTLSIAVWGWVLASRGRDAAGGVVWGLFAFKPVWALAFFLVPLLQRRWRFLGAMVGTGVALGVATFPVVGVQAWFDWLAVGREAAALYNVNESWIHLSRDLQGIPRRYLHDFSKPEAERETRFAALLAWGLWGAVFVPTVAIGLWRGGRRAVGLGAAFLFWGAFLTCYRFMYYDVLLALMGFAALAGEPGRLLRTRVVRMRVSPPVTPPDVPPPAADDTRALGYVNSFALTVLFGLYALENVLIPYDLKATAFVGGWSRTKPDGTVGPATFELVANLDYPWDTYLIVLLWAWAGVKLLWRAEPGEKTACPVLPPGGAAPLQ
ncbi:glycosyltransferase family 87 protein [Urbifossiella limnaea]|uniref:DUF2029 domain-containing protein n=1 Tax=Urbifossiella limnaea TaxID=2528023 RepID=A0A517XSF0_9BACT|nr:glycosyltransferase family 87 protein [Urbifossiella limnaea]QDU20413.1 hypothetical protein ETAA1_23650 [Urbifossiella limnaea]